MSAFLQLAERRTDEIEGNLMQGEYLEPSVTNDSGGLRKSVDGDDGCLRRTGVARRTTCCFQHYGS